MDLVISLPNGKELKGAAFRKTEGVVEKDGKSYLRTRIWMEGLGDDRGESTRLFRREDSGLYSLSEKGGQTKEQTEMLFPIKVGNSWKTTDREGEELTVKVVGIEKVTIGDKVYENCYHIRSDSADGGSEDYWEAPKVGTVRSELVSPNGVKVVVTLKEFKAGK